MQYELDKCEKCLHKTETYIRCASYVDAYRTIYKSIGEGASFDNAIVAWMERNCVTDEEIVFNTLRNNVLALCKNWDTHRSECSSN